MMTIAQKLGTCFHFVGFRINKMKKKKKQQPLVK